MKKSFKLLGVSLLSCSFLIGCNWIEVSFLDVSIILNSLFEKVKNIFSFPQAHSLI